MEPDDDSLWEWAGEAVPHTIADNYKDGFFGPGRSVVVQWFHGETYFYKAGDITWPHPDEWYDCQLVLKASKMPLQMKNHVIRGHPQGKGEARATGGSEHPRGRTGDGARTKAKGRDP